MEVVCRPDERGNMGEKRLKRRRVPLEIISRSWGNYRSFNRICSFYEYEMNMIVLLN